MLPKKKHFLQLSSVIPALHSSLVFVALKGSMGISQGWFRVTLMTSIRRLMITSAIDDCPHFQTVTWLSIPLSVCLPAYLFFLSRSHYDTWTERGNWCGYTCPKNKVQTGQSAKPRCMLNLDVCSTASWIKFENTAFPWSLSRNIMEGNISFILHFPFKNSY